MFSLWLLSTPRYARACRFPGTLQLVRFRHIGTRATTLYCARTVSEASVRFRPTTEAVVLEAKMDETSLAVRDHIYEIMYYAPDSFRC